MSRPILPGSLAPRGIQSTMRHRTGGGGPGKAVGFGLAERERLPGRARWRPPGSGARRARFPNGGSRKVVAKMRHLLGFVLAIIAGAALFFGAGWGVAKLVAMNGNGEKL